MNANFEELALIAQILHSKKIVAQGLVHANYGCSSFLQYKAYGLEFFLDRNELEASLKGSTTPLTTWVKAAGDDHRAYYKLIR